MPSSPDEPHDRPSTSPEETTIFRADALRHRARQRGPGDVVRIAPRWTTSSFYALLTLLAATIVAGSIIQIDRYADATTTTDDAGRLIALVPAAVAPDVARGRPVDLGAVTAEVVSSDGRVLYPSEVAARYGVEVAVPSVALVTSARGSAGDVQSARVLVESDPVIVALVPGLDAILGDGDG